MVNKIKPRKEEIETGRGKEDLAEASDAPAKDLATAKKAPQSPALKALREMKVAFDYKAVVCLGSGVSKTNKLRAEFAAELALKKAGTKLVMTGGQVSKFHKGAKLSEAEEAQQHLSENEYYKEALEQQKIETLLEKEAGNTYENIANVVPILKAQGITKFVLVTDTKSHALRALKRVNTMYPEAEVTFYCPGTPNIDQNIGGLQVPTVPQEQIEAHKGYKGAQQLLTNIFKLSKSDIKPEEVLAGENPFVIDVLDFAEQKQKEGLNLIEAQKNEKSLVLKFTNPKTKEETTITIEEGEKLFNAILFPERKETILANERARRMQLLQESVGSGLLGQPEEPAGALHGKYKEELDKIEAEVTIGDIETIKGSTIEDIRYKSFLLEKEPEMKDGKHTKELVTSLKQETQRRLKAYTSGYDGQWYTIDYLKMKNDPSGLSHEMNIGLGDILLDTDVKTILVQKNSGELVKAHRGIVPSGMHAGRVGFLDENNEYVATFTGEKFRILTGDETDITSEKSVQAYIENYTTEFNARQEHKKTFEASRRFGGGLELYNNNDIAKYMENRAAIEAKLNPEDVSKIPPTERVAEIPKKPKGSKRMVIFGDTNGSYGTEGQKHLAELQAQLPEWNADFVLGVGDYISAGGGGVTDEQYGKLSTQVKEEFKKFGQTPFALAIGNHDKNPKGKSDNLKEVFQKKLEEEFNYEETTDKSAYSYTLGNATFVVFNDGSKGITDVQTKFFEEKSLSSKGAVYLVNHVPPFQHAHGSGLPEDGSESVKNFDKIQKIAKENVEGKGQPFYVISGHDHFHSVIGNFLNPGGMGSAYFGLDGKLKSEPSAAVVDMDENGKITAVYFRSAKSSFKDPLPEIQHALAWGKEAELQRLKPSPNMKAISESNIVRVLEGHRPGEGQKIMDYSKKICEELGLPVAVLWAMTKTESNFNPLSKNPKSTATGLTQFLSSSWESFLKKIQRSGVHHPEWDLPAKTDQGGFTPSRYNPYASLYAAALMMKTTQKEFGIQNKSPQEQGEYYYLAHHEGHAGARAYMKFLRIMEKEGYTTRGDIARLYSMDRDKFNRLTRGVFVGSQINRIAEKGINKFLGVYFGLCKRIGLRVAASTIGKETPDTVATINPDTESKMEGEMVTSDRLYMRKMAKGGKWTKEIIDIRKGRPNLLIGSSSVVGQSKLALARNTNVFGFGGYSTKRILSKLKELWPQIAKRGVPKKVVILGTVLNDFGRPGKTKMTARLAVKRHIELIKFLEGKGVADVKISTPHHNMNRAKTEEFTRILLEEYPQYALKVGERVPKSWTSDGIHLNNQGKAYVQKIYDRYFA